MTVTPIGSSPVQGGSDASGKPQQAQEHTTVTTHCNKRHWHDQSCPHTVTTRPVPRGGEAGKLIDQTI